MGYIGALSAALGEHLLSRRTPRTLATDGFDRSRRNLALTCGGGRGALTLRARATPSTHRQHLCIRRRHRAQLSGKLPARSWCGRFCLPASTCAAGGRDSRRRPSPHRCRTLQARDVVEHGALASIASAGRRQRVICHPQRSHACPACCEIEVDRSHQFPRCQRALPAISAMSTSAYRVPTFTTRRGHSARHACPPRMGPPRRRPRCVRPASSTAAGGRRALCLFDVKCSIVTTCRRSLP